MYIQSYISKGQHVFEDYQINLSKKGEVIPQERANQLEFSEVVAEQDPEGKNHYTFIIGENGSGKTSLLKSLVVEQFCKRAPYGWSDVIDGGTSYIKYMASNSSQSQARRDAMDFNKIIYCSNSAFLRVKEKDYNTYFEYTPNQTSLKESLLQALMQYRCHIGKLNTILRKDDAVWKIRIEYIPQRRYEHPNGAQVFIPDSTVKIISDFIQFVKLQVAGKGITKEEQNLSKLLERIMSDKFLQVAWRRNPTMQNIYVDITESLVFKKLERLYKAYFPDGHSERIANRKYDNRDYAACEIEDKSLEELEPRDLWLLPLLSHVGVIRYDVLVNDISSDYFSSGEQVMAQLFCNLAPVCDDLNKSNILFLYDEPETSLHPKWQQEFPLLFQDVVDEVFGITDSHFILCTHSPLIIMKAVDLPNSSVLKFTYDKGKFKSEKITDINKYCVEELLLDEFDISYFPKSQRNLMEDAIKHMSPTDAIVNTEELKTKIDNLYQEVMRQ